MTPWLWIALTLVWLAVALLAWCLGRINADAGRRAEQMQREEKR